MRKETAKMRKETARKVYPSAQDFCLPPISGTPREPCHKLSFLTVFGVTLASEKPGGQWGAGVKSLGQR